MARLLRKLYQRNNVFLNIDNIRKSNFTISSQRQIMMSLRASWFSEYYRRRLDVPGCFCDFMQGRNDDDLRDSISIFQEFLEDNKFTALGTKSVSPGMIRYDYLLPSKFEGEYFYINLNGLVRLVSLKQYNELKRNDIEFEDVKIKYAER